MAEQAKIYDFNEMTKKRWQDKEHGFQELRNEIRMELEELQDRMSEMQKELKLAREREDREMIDYYEDEILYLHEQMSKALAPLLELRKKIDEDKRKYVENKKRREGSLSQQ